ncbi:MAG: MobC family plasmid mobilization relaxosome protein [Oribacterium sp.]|nr:MobC family plasmid mobilization relaxosome protein [Oribacterium sp.]
MDKDRHTVERKIYFTPGQCKEIERRAKLLNKRPNVYIRDMAVHGEIKHYDFEKYQELIYPLRGIGVNINQIAMVANSTGEVYKKDIEDIKEYLRRLRVMFDAHFSELKYELIE